jgi:hypothetical protein
MRQIAISVLLGFLALPAFFFGAELFDVNGQPTPLTGIVSGCTAVALCLAVCQFLVAGSSGGEAAAGAAATGMFTAGQRPREISVLLPGWSLPLAMLAPVVGICCLMLLLDPKPGERTAPAFLSAGIIGVLAGAALAKSTVKRGHAGMSRERAWRILRPVGAGMFGAVAVILVAVVAPPVAARHDFPRSAATGLMVVALFQLALAAAFLLKRTPGAMLTAAAGAAGFVLGGLLAVIGGAYISNGLVMRVPAALFLCAALDLCACGSCVMATWRARGFRDERRP